LSLFNPRPPLLAGDPNEHTAAALGEAVSIRARHCWRAIQENTDTYRVTDWVSIRARHCWRAIRRALSLPPSVVFDS
jgi:hypothetical protein